MEPFQNKYNWEGINHPSGTDDFLRKIIQQFLLMCYMLKNKYISCLHFKTQHKSWGRHSFNNSKRRKMGLHFGRKLSVLLRGIITKHNGDCYRLNCIHSFTTKNKAESYNKYVKIKTFVML